MAAGKSTVSAMLAERGFFIVDADKTAHDVIQTEKVLRKLTDAFGEGILDESGNIDRKKLSVCVFGEKKNEVQDKTCPGNAANASAERIAAEKKSRVELLNDIVHPAVIESLFEQAETAKQLPDCPGVVLDVPLLIESGLHKRCDSVILVTANIETRYARIMKRDGLSRREARARIAAQMPQWKKKRRRCHDGSPRKPLYLHDLSLRPAHLCPHAAATRVARSHVRWRRPPVPAICKGIHAKTGAAGGDGILSAAK